MTIRLSVDPIRNQYSAVWRTREFLLGALLAIVFFIAGTQTVLANDTNIVTLYVDGVTRTVSSKDQTVGQFLDSVGVSVNQKDLVEPSRDTPINSDGFKINVYRARPVLVIDGDHRETVVSPLNSPRLIAESAGLTVYPEDEFVLERVDNILQDGIVGQRLIIHRAAVVNFDIYGETKVFRTQKNTVGELLREKKITMRPEDTLDVPTESAILTGMTIHLDRTGKETLTVDEPVPYDQDVILDINMDSGTSRIETPGVNGVKSVTYELNMVNGHEVGRTKIQEVITTPAKKERIVKGIKVNAPVGNVAANKQAIMQAAGIMQADWNYVDFIIAHESTWNTGARNPVSGAYGLCQALPGSKMASAGADWATNPVTQMRWCDGYAKSRYGGWANAYAVWLRQRWW